MEEYFFDAQDDIRSDKVFALIIYDIVDNKKRVRFAKYLQGYGNRVQKSAFEAMLPKKKYDKLLCEIPAFITDEDSVRVYRIRGRGQVSVWGVKTDFDDEEDIILI